MSISSASNALLAGKCLQLHYDGFTRTVEVHTVGYTRDGNGIMRAWQVSGGSQSGEVPGWKLFRFDRTFSTSVTDEDSEAPRPGYKRNDSHITQIVRQV